MNRFRQQLANLQNKKSLKPLSPAFRHIEFLVFGPGDVTASAPHIVDTLDSKRYMSMAVLALMPLSLASVYFYGWRAVAMILVSYIFAGITELLFAFFRKKEITEGFFVTGLIFPLILPPTIPLWIVAVGTVVGVFFGKEVFGGTGRNIFNPAIVGRVFVTIAFPLLMTTLWQLPFTEGLGGFLNFSRPDAITSATPLGIFSGGEAALYSYSDLLLGRAPGSMGETFRLLIILAGVFLIIVKISNWRIPVAYLGSVAVFSQFGSMFYPGRVAPPLFQLLTGGLLFAAFFMATDPVTSPFTKQGKWIFGLMLGMFTVLIRGFAGAVEGVMFSIILMNALTPVIDSLVLKFKFKPIKDYGVV
ncbi:MAG: RnfABCDGE type electron transport complex subunit D [Dethiobacter sp.]|nr:RnfABCDGE type electron transport complex subunit D [Dethiobacter sp.]